MQGAGQARTKPRLGRPPGPGRQVRAAVLKATTAELIDQGYSELRPERVAARAGVGRTTVYRHWGTRQALVRDALVQWQQADVPPLELVGRWEDDLLVLCRHLRSELQRPLAPVLLRTLVTATAEDQELTDELQRLWRTRTSSGLQAIEQARARGEVRSALTAAEVFEMTTAMFLSRALVTHLPVDDDFVDQVHRLVLAAST